MQARRQPGPGRQHDHDRGCCPPGRRPHPSCDVPDVPAVSPQVTAHTAGTARRMRTVRGHRTAAPAAHACPQDAPAPPGRNTDPLPYRP